VLKAGENFMESALQACPSPTLERAGIVLSTWHGGQHDHELDELNFRVAANWVSFGYQVLLLSLTPFFMCWRILKLLWTELLKPRPVPLSLPQNKCCCSNQFPTLANVHPTERWYFINGVCTDHNWLQRNCQRLERAFDRPVVGIYNETNDIVVDVLECFAQRNLNFSTQAGRDAASAIREDIRNGVTNVVLIGHSQGGIIASIVLQLLDHDDLAKVSTVLTFSSAADEYPNLGGQVVMEHYANRHDLVAKLGPHYFYQTPLYHGRLFVAERHGHLLNTFYTLQPADYALVHGPPGQSFLSQYAQAPL
jgi:predicted esterase